MNLTLKKITQFISKYKFSIITFLFLAHISNVLGKTNILNVATALSFMALLVFLAKTKYTQPFLLLFGFLLSVDVFFAFFFGDRFNVGMLASIMDTNPGEVQGAARNMLIWGLPILIGTLGLLYLCSRELKAAKIRKGIAIAIFGAYWLLFVPIFCANMITQREFWKDEMKLSAAFTMYFVTAHKFPVIYNNLLVLKIYLDGKDDFSAYAHAERGVPEGIVYEENQFSPKKIYLIVGESARRDHLSLYGYPRKTTPFLDDLMAKDTINAKHYDAIACATLTREVIRLTFSFAYPCSFNCFDKSKNLVEMLKAADYKTYWISSQSRMGLHETNVSVISATADFSYHEKKYPTEDLELIDMVKDELVKGEKQFFVLHLDGSHIWYPDKYDEVDAKAIGGEDNDVTHYDRTIHHTDRVLQKLYDVANQDGSDYVMLYFSDHGEIIGVGHGFKAEGTGNIDIPFLTVNNSSFPIDSVVAKYVDPESNLINNTNVINVISEFAGYKTTDEYVKNAVEQGKYVYFPDMSVVPYKDLLKNKKITRK